MPPIGQPLPLALALSGAMLPLHWRMPTGPCAVSTSEVHGHLVTAANDAEMDGPRVVLEPLRSRAALPVSRKVARHRYGVDGTRLSVVGAHVSGLDGVPVGAPVLVEMPRAYFTMRDRHGRPRSIYGAAARFVGYVDGFGVLRDAVPSRPLAFAA